MVKVSKSAIGGLPTIRFQRVFPVKNAAEYFNQMSVTRTVGQMS